MHLFQELELNINMKHLYYVAGLPRSGSTLLGSILNKHEHIHVTPTSPIADLICLTEQNVRQLHNQYTFDIDVLLNNVVQGIFNCGFKHISKQYIFDKHRAWPRNHIIAQNFLDSDFKGILTYRPIPEIITSYLKLIRNDSNNFVDKHLKKDGKPLSTENRADYLWRYYISDPYQSCLHGLNTVKDKLLPLSYDEIVLDTKNALHKIEYFFNIKDISKINFSNIVNTCSEQKDEAWGMKDLHTIRSEINKTSDDAKVILGSVLYNLYSKFNLKV